MNFKKIFTISIIPSIFFILSLLTISHYGISWDEPMHFSRGQAYLHYFLSGDLHYSKEDFSSRPSYYQVTSYDAEFFMKNDSGHPPLNGILAATSNYIFYQKLGTLGDIDSYHLFNIVSSTFLVLVVSIFAAQTYGLFAAFISGIVIASYPLFFAESHFNIKDPAETAFFAACIWAFWNALKKYSWRWLLASILFFAGALGTKFNILFLPFIIIPYLILRFGKNSFNLFRNFRKLPKIFLILLFLAPIIIIAIFFLTWPYLWQNPLNNTLNIFRYYKDIGTGGLGQPKFIIWKGFNLFPITWVMLTTPPITIFLSALSILGVYQRWREKEKIFLLWAVWLIVPILRVSMPGSSIYGGARQIMEFLPALALLSGLGALTLFKFFQSRRWIIVVIFLLFTPHFVTLIKLHPNENVYFNFLIGGLPGAQKARIPYFGNSLGNAYLQAVKWINTNAEKNSRLALVQATMVNIPKSYLRPDIRFANSFWSGINRGGEYLVELTHGGSEVAYPFAWDFVNTVLIPVYEVQVEGVTIAKVWKNDLVHSRPEYQNEENISIRKIIKDNDALIVELLEEVALARIKINFGSDYCTNFANGTIYTSLDGVIWDEETEKLPEKQVVAYPSLEKGKLHFIFPARLAKFIKIKTGSLDSCLFQNLDINVGGFRYDEVAV
ncbi:MAG: 4-amino-4-deoxy-L-arabinose transferase and related glycosyltransferase of PMT family-like protein [Berkelbacteria bacterium GW2011_GWA1_36_9]|uniref:4-amino-4-deoxy-L-arabinose transferase and related glycosyltransferase of PMT family-like protein n=1 Tax=Berkelbacteria bacterium GW2011_GWA1_36_9 TaxID=1618331 RepID=A0A0G0FHD1_9BACT|nr:MAG: 4-amino-4-deoxy-L-arabinose transferase and related glycosyltransferase of PMT family-like protein [Berkelbacteria bacterium GW2011_GWA1_36_9]